MGGSTKRASTLVASTDSTLPTLPTIYSTTNRPWSVTRLKTKGEEEGKEQKRTGPCGTWGVE